MTENAGRRRLIAVLSDRPMYLTISLFVFLLLSPLFGTGYRGEATLHASFTLILLSALWATQSRLRRLIAAVVGVPWMALFWLDMVIDVPGWADTAAGISMVAFFAFLIIEMIRGVLKQERVSKDTIFQAVSAYLLLGVTWMGLYALVYRADPAAINFPGTVPIADWKPLLYFSYTTLTTLGYGDITPVSPIARSLAMVESTVGPLYLAVLLARLVSLYSREKRVEVED